ncbi:SGNH/GDSL hydrolase family protein [Nitrospira sp. Nam80]
MWKVAVHCHLARTIGLGLFFVATLAYRSQNPAVFGIWSWPYLVIVLTAGSLFLASVLHSRRCHQDEQLWGETPALRSVCVDLAVLFWGSGYVINGFEAARNWGQIADLNFFGSATPPAVLLLWVAMLTAWLSLARTVVLWKRRSRLGGIIVAVWVAIIVLLVAEGALRLWGLAAPRPQGYPTYTTALWSRKFASLNELGFRDAEHTVHKPPDVQRVLIVGDSLAFGWGVTNTDDRFGEQLAAHLRKQTAANWEVLNASLGDTNTLAHIQYLQTMQRYQPDVILLLYAFNDIDYVVPVTPREGPSEPMTGLRDRLSPVRLLFTNCFLFQEVYVRLRMLAYQAAASEGQPYEDPYNNEAILDRHLQDVSRFVSVASRTSAIVAIVPFDIKIVASPAHRDRYRHFVHAAMTHGLPVWPAGPEVFARHAYSDLIVNKLDSHPNAIAHQLLAARIANPLHSVLQRNVQVTKHMSQ